MRRAVEDLFGWNSGRDAFVWLSTRPYKRTCWKIDLAACRAEAVRLYDSRAGHLIHRGDVPPHAVVKGLGLPPLMGGR